MKYDVFVHSKLTPEERLAAALRGDTIELSVYVIGMIDEQALAKALLGEANEQDLLQVAKRTKFIESIGTTDRHNSEETLVGIARKRIAQLEAQDGKI